MPERPLLSRWFQLGGCALVVIGLVLWATLRISSMFPPYVVTALIAIGYGEFCRRRERSASAGPS